MDTKKKLKRYRLRINPEKGALVDFISQVEDPAIEVGFLKFKEDETLHLKFNEDKMELFGPILIPDMPIYRVSETMGEYEVYFTVEDIKEIQMHFMKNGFQNNINLDHTSKDAGTYLFGFFQSSDLIPNPTAFKDLPLGTLYAHMKVESMEVWNDIKNGNRTGFSIEGVFEMFIEEFEKNYLQKINVATTNRVDTQQKITIEEMFKNLFKKETLEKMSEAFADLASDFNKVASADYKIASREVGQKVEVVAEDGSLTNAADGTYEFEDGFKFTVKDGLIESIDGEVPVAEEEVVEATEEVLADPLEEVKGAIAELQKQMADVLKMIADSNPEAMRNDIEQTLSKEIKDSAEEIKTQFSVVFEKFSKIPAEESKVVKNVVRDSNKRNFEQFIASLNKK